MRAVLVVGGFTIAAVGLVIVACVGDQSGSASDDAGTGSETGGGTADGSVATDDAGSDAGCAACVDAAGSDGSVAFSVKALPGIVLWLEGSMGLDTTGTKVNQWSDQSGSGNNAVPAAGSVGPQTGLLSSKPALSFNKDSRLEIADVASMQWGTGDFLIEMVVAYSNPLTDAGYTYGELFFKQLNSAPFPGIVLLGNSQTDFTAKIGLGLDSTTAINTTTAGYNDGKARLVGARRVGQTLEIRINGIVAATATNAGVARDVSAIGRVAALGGQIGQTALVGSYAEIIAVKGTTSVSDLTALELYAVKKYGL